MVTAASGYGLLTLHGDTVLDAWFPSPVLGATEGEAPAELAALAGTDEARGVRTEVRRVERALPDEYRVLVARSLGRLTPVTHATVAQIADLPDVVRGYEDIKLANVETFRARAVELEEQLARGAQSGGFTLPMARG